MPVYGGTNKLASALGLGDVLGQRAYRATVDNLGNLFVDRARGNQANAKADLLRQRFDANRGLPASIASALGMPTNEGDMLGRLIAGASSNNPQQSAQAIAIISALLAKNPKAAAAATRALGKDVTGVSGGMEYAKNVLPGAVPAVTLPTGAADIASDLANAVQSKASAGTSNARTRSIIDRMKNPEKYVKPSSANAPKPLGLLDFKKWQALFAPSAPDASAQQSDIAAHAANLMSLYRQYTTWASQPDNAGKSAAEVVNAQPQWLELLQRGNGDVVSPMAPQGMPPAPDEPVRRLISLKAAQAAGYKLAQDKATGEVKAFDGTHWITVYRAQ